MVELRHNYELYKVGKHTMDGKTVWVVGHWDKSGRMHPHKFSTKTALYKSFPWMRGKV